jgi:hypothetical protein
MRNTIVVEFIYNAIDIERLTTSVLWLYSPNELPTREDITDHLRYILSLNGARALEDSIIKPSDQAKQIAKELFPELY